MANDAGKQNTSSISTAESQHSFWLYVHAVDTCNNCETFEIICWALTLIGGPGPTGVRPRWGAQAQDTAEVSVYD